MKRDFHPILKLLPQIANSVFSYVFGNAEQCDRTLRGQARICARYEKRLCGVVRDFDNGIGIFTKVQNTLGLSEKRYAILELAKGKFTSDPDSHTGEGIFFSSKAADEFVILSDHLMFVGKTSKKIAENGLDCGFSRI